MRTMSELKKSVSIHKNIPLNEEVMYFRLMVMNALKNVSIQTVLILCTNMMNF